MIQKRCYYDILQVDRSASDEEISQAYRRLAMEFHPDRNPDDDEAVTRFKEAAEAFEVISNPDKRSLYDQYGHAGLESMAGGAPHFHDVSDIFDAFGGLFGDFFGGMSRGRRVQRGSDIRCDVTLDLIEAAKGVEKKTVRFQRHEKCETCGGSGAKKGTVPETCSYCGGRGQVVQSTGIFSMRTTCPSCNGSGKIVREKCSDCRGAGYVRRRVTRKVDIPAGVDNDNRLRLFGEGEPSPNGGPPGDCYCFIKVAKHPLFERQGQHLICQIPISYSLAALGGEIEVPTLERSDQLSIPAGTQSGEVFKLKGRGMPDPRRQGRGDMLVQVHVEVARKITSEHKEILQKFTKNKEGNLCRKDCGNNIDKIQKLLIHFNMKNKCYNK